MRTANTRWFVHNKIFFSIYVTICLQDTQRHAANTVDNTWYKKLSWCWQRARRV